VTAIAEYTPLWPLVEPVLLARQPARFRPPRRPGADGWLGPWHSPLRADKHPSFSVKPDSATDPGAFLDRASGETGSMAELARQLGIDPRISRAPLQLTPRRDKPSAKAESTSRAKPAAASSESPLERFCRERKFDPGRLRATWGIKPTSWRETWSNGNRSNRMRAALVYPTPLGIDRLRFLDGDRPKYRWLHRGGRAHWYGLKQALALGSGGPFYLVNGEPSVWAAQQSGVPALSLCGESAHPTPALLHELGEAGVGEIRVVYDNDPAGWHGARRVVEAFEESGIKAEACELPEDLGEHGDVDDLHRRTGDAGLRAALEQLPRLRSEEEQLTYEANHPAPLEFPDAKQRKRRAPAAELDLPIIPGTGYLLDRQNNCVRTRRGQTWIPWLPTLERWGTVDDGDAGMRIWYQIRVGDLAERVLQHELADGSAWERFGDPPGSAGRKNVDLLANLVRQLATEQLPIRGYTSTGWRTTSDGRQLYLSGGASIGADGACGDLIVLLPTRLERFVLSEPPTDEARGITMRASMALLDLPRSISVPLVGAVYLAPLRELLPGAAPDFTLWIQGPSQVGKSELAALAQAHWGSFDRQSLPANFDDTPNSLEPVLYHAKDALVVVDDRHPGAGDPSTMHNIRAVTQRLLRTVGNQSNRHRLGRNLQSQPERPIRCLAIATSESGIEGESAESRAFVVPIPPGAFALAELGPHRDRRVFYAQAMAGYIQWLAKNWAALTRRLPIRFGELRARAQSAGHARGAGQVAHLYLGLEVATRYAVEVGAGTAPWRRELLKEAWEILARLASEQASELLEETPVQRFVSLLADGLASHSVHLLKLDDPAHPPPNADAVGWIAQLNGFSGQTLWRPGGSCLGMVTEEAYLLYAQQTYAYLQRASRDQGRVFTVDMRTLLARLDEAGYITISEETGVRHRQIKVRIGGERRRVIKLWRRAIELEDGEETSSYVDSVDMTLGVGPVGPVGPATENGSAGADFELENDFRMTSRPAPLPGPTQKPSGAGQDGGSRNPYAEQPKNGDVLGRGGHYYDDCRACGRPLDVVAIAAGFGLHLDCTLTPERGA
jgi:hypothetical protein